MKISLTGRTFLKAAGLGVRVVTCGGEAPDHRRDVDRPRPGRGRAPGAESNRAGGLSGRIELVKMSVLDRMITQALKAKDEDRRDWTAIRAWAQTGPA